MAVPIKVTVNGRTHESEVEPREFLVSYLREVLSLTGTHVGCDTSSCGACTVIVDGQAIKSCTMLAVQADGCEITTIEGLAPNGSLHPLQEAFAEEHGLQCGVCTPGFLMALHELIDDEPNPSEEQIRDVLGGQLCRCTGYAGILRAVHSAFAKLGASPSTESGA